jgi:hypothetical protein
MRRALSCPPLSEPQYSARQSDIQRWQVEIIESTATDMSDPYPRNLGQVVTPLAPLAPEYDAE